MTVKQDLTYQSDYQRSTFDLYYPKEAQGPVPVIFGSMGRLCRRRQRRGQRVVVDETKAAVISINYEWAPSLHYPDRSNISPSGRLDQSRCPSIPMLISINSSSGILQEPKSLGNMALQTNPAYAKEMSFDQDIPASALKGFISYCGPLDLKQIAGTSSDDRFMKFCQNGGLVVIRQKEWQDSPQLQEISLVDKLTADFPPTYITDGNAYSFEDQGIAFANQLQALDIP